MDLIDRQSAIEITKMFTESIDAKLIKNRLLALPSAHPTQSNTLNALDCISRQAAIDAAKEELDNGTFYDIPSKIEYLPSAQPERLTDDDFETIRIHLSAHKEKLCNQRRWKDAEEYQRIIDRFMSFASAQPEQRWIPCSERLPKAFEYCLWTTTDGKVVYHYCDGQFSKYIAWMPLPEPYEERKEHEK